MFGSGNEPTLEECKKIFSADYYPYDAGTIKSFSVQRVKSLKADGTEIGSIDVSSFTSDFKSAGSAHDEWKNRKKIKRIGSVDLGTLNWEYNTNNIAFYGYFENKKIGARNLLCQSYTTTESNIGGWLIQDLEIGGSKNYPYLYIKDSKYTDVDTFKQAMQGVLLYYELAEPTAETIPEIDNYLEVEGGGTLTFESDDTVKMPIPSTTRFVVDLTTTTEETA